MNNLRNNSFTSDEDELDFDELLEKVEEELQNLAKSDPSALTIEKEESVRWDKFSFFGYGSHLDPIFSLLIDKRFEEFEPFFKDLILEDLLKLEDSEKDCQK